MSNKELIVICGPMFSGKTSMLISQAAIYVKQGLQVAVIKPELDDRYDKLDIVAHTGERMSDLKVPMATMNIDGHLYPQFQGEFIKDHIDIFIVDEAQFFTKTGLNALKLLGLATTRGIVFAGLDLDVFGNPFGFMGQLLCEATTVTKLKGVCSVCGDDSSRTFRKDIDANKEIVVVGGSELYETRCYNHWIDGMNNYFQKTWL